MAITQPGGKFGPPQNSPTGSSKQARSETGYGTVRVGFGLSDSKFDGVPAKSSQVREGRGSMPNTNGSYKGAGK